MSANTYLQVSELDFNDIRSNLKSYLNSQDQFQDYDFEGSAMSVLLDVLAYNTHYNAYYLNMIGNEMFLDTAQQRDSVVSRAKELGYLPVSSNGATAEVVLNFTGLGADVTQFTLPKNSKFTTTVDDVTYTFVTPKAEEFFKAADGTFSKSIEIKEGEPLTHQFTVSATNPVRYIIPNPGVDTSSIVVSVQESSTDSTTTDYKRATNIKQVFSTSPVFYLEESADEKYEIIFGSGSLGKPVKAGNIVKVEYLVNSGEATNGATAFSVEDYNIGTSYTSATISSVAKTANGGRPQETVESIKFQAPRNYQTQNRAVIAEDYSRILLSENADLQSVIAFGGEEYDPPVNGKVYIAVKPFGELRATQNKKTAIKTSLKTRTPLAVDPVIIDGEYTYIIPTVSAFYDLTTSSFDDSGIASNIRTAITSFATDNLERFGNKFRFSRFVRTLDNTSNGAILNTDASIKIQRRMTPDTNVASLLSVSFNNQIRKGTLESSSFTYNGFTSYLIDVNGIVKIIRYNSSNEQVDVVPNAGTIDYVNGIIKVDNFAVTAYSDNFLKVTVTPEKLDVTPIREQVLLMDANDASITVTGEQ